MGNTCAGKSSALENTQAPSQRREHTNRSSKKPSQHQDDANRSRRVLGHKPTNSTEIHARWGEPTDNPEDYSVCTNFEANPFKLGFCRNCQRQHDVSSSGSVKSMKVANIIAPPAVAKSAANACKRKPSLSEQYPQRESDVDLPAVLQHRRKHLQHSNSHKSKKSPGQSQVKHKKRPSQPKGSRLDSSPDDWI